jgi:hypothetical protein
MPERVLTRAEVYRNRGRRLDAQQREKRRADREQQAREAKREALRTKGRTLDQVERCYRQHTPPQIEKADEMKLCGDIELRIPLEDITS